VLTKDGQPVQRLPNFYEKAWGNPGLGSAVLSAVIFSGLMMTASL
jgi:hypothetical protein